MAMKHLNFRAKNVKILLIFRMSKNSKIIFQGVRKFKNNFFGCPKIKNIFLCGPKLPGNETFFSDFLTLQKSWTRRVLSSRE